MALSLAAASEKFLGDNFHMVKILLAAANEKCSRIILNMEKNSLPAHGVFKGLSRATKWCTPKNYIFWNLLCMLVNVGGAKEIRKFGQHLQPGHYYALLFVPRYKYAQMYCNIYNGPILTFKTPKSTNLGSRN